MRLVSFSIQVIDIIEKLPETKVGNHIAGQMLRSGTSVSANYGEAQSAESRRDFVHKLQVALKELRETQVWLIIIHHKHLIEPGDSVNKALRECDELIAIFVASVVTARRNMGNVRDE